MVRRVLMVAACPFPVPRGTPIRVYRSAEALVKRGHLVEVATYHVGDAHTAPFPIVRSPDVRVYRHRDPGPTLTKLLLLDPLLVRTVRARLARAKFDAVHAHHYEGLLVALAARGRGSIPIVYDAHTLLGSELPFYRVGLPRRVTRRLGTWLDRALPRRADSIVAVSEEIREWLARSGGLRPNSIFVVPNGVEAEAFRPAVPQEGASDVERTLVFAGNLAPYQGFDALLAAFRKVREHRDDVRLRIVLGKSGASTAERSQLRVGAANSEGELGPYESTARALGVRPFIDVTRANLGSLPGELASARIALNPRGACPGLPQKLLNYMASGRAIVSFSGSAKAIAHGETGWVVADGDVDAFAAGILRLLEDASLARRLGENARREAERAYTWDAVAARLEEVYTVTLGLDGSRR